MMNKIQTGTRVHYISPHGSKENGRVKSIQEGSVFVVFNCAGDWDNFRNYTGQNTRLEDLKFGWVDDNGRLLPEYCDHHYIHTDRKWQSENQQECVYCGHVIN